MANATGGAGMAPPPGAPTEVTRELSPELIQQQLAKARANEKELAPWGNFEKTSAPPPVAKTAEFFEPARPTEPAPPAVVVGSPFQASPNDPESPARGRPQPISDPGKAVTGGFGEGPSFYVPLDGTEVKNLVLSKLDEIIRQMDDDLRFSIHLTYPRAQVTVQVIVEGFADPQHDIVIRKVASGERAPVEVAKQHADEVVFVLTAQHVEMTAEGESVTPPNAVREQIGSQIPRKQRISSGGSTAIVDVLG